LKLFQKPMFFPALITVSTLHLTMTLKMRKFYAAINSDKQKKEKK